MGERERGREKGRKNLGEEGMGYTGEICDMYVVLLMYFLKS